MVGKVEIPQSAFLAVLKTDSDEVTAYGARRHLIVRIEESKIMGKTVAEKIFATHVVDRPAEDVWVLRLDAVFCHEITTPIAIVDLMRRGKDRVFDPSRIKAVIDHVTPPRTPRPPPRARCSATGRGATRSRTSSTSGRNGVCHALFPEKGFIRPGYTVIMGDSHTCTHGAFGAFAAGVGTTDLEVGILKGVCAFRQPKTMRVNLNGDAPAGGVTPRT